MANVKKNKFQHLMDMIQIGTVEYTNTYNIVYARLTYCANSSASILSPPSSSLGLANKTTNLRLPGQVERSGKRTSARIGIFLYIFPYYEHGRAAHAHGI
jgi:hypothetical protein